MSPKLEGEGGAKMFETLLIELPGTKVVWETPGNVCDVLYHTRSP